MTSSSADGILIPLPVLILVAASVSRDGGEVILESHRRLKTDTVWDGIAADANLFLRYRYKRTTLVFGDG